MSKIQSCYLLEVHSTMTINLFQWSFLSFVNNLVFKLSINFRGSSKQSLWKFFKLTGQHLLQVCSSRSERNLNGHPGLTQVVDAIFFQTGSHTLTCSLQHQWTFWLYLPLNNFTGPLFYIAHVSHIWLVLR